MLNIKEITKAIKQLAEEKGLDYEKVLEVVEASLAAAYKREYCERGEIVRAKMNAETGQLDFWKVKTVVDETTVRFVEEGEEAEEAPRIEEDIEGRLPRYNPDRHILLEEAKKEKKGVKVGDELIFPLETKEDFGRIAAQVAKQTILQRIREAERDSVLGEWREKEGQIVSGIVQRIERGNIFVDFGKAIGVMFANESIPGEHYRSGERLRFLVLAVQEDTRLPGIILSRSHPKFVAKLFELEVPEIADGSVEVKAIAREPGSRTKIAVASHAEGVDPIGACVGQRGTRVMAVNNELGQEKIDIIEWSDDPAKLIGNALSPARAESVEIFERREARVYVPEDQLSLAIGRGGQNVRMAVRLSGWKIDVRSQARPEEAQEGGVATPAAVEASGKEAPDETPEEVKEEIKEEAVAEELLEEAKEEIEEDMGEKLPEEEEGATAAEEKPEEKTEEATNVPKKKAAKKKAK